MSVSDNELEQYLNEFERYTYSIGAATARVARVRSLPPFFENLTWDPPKIVMY